MMPLSHLHSPPLNAETGAAAWDGDHERIYPTRSFPDWGKFRPAKVRSTPHKHNVEAQSRRRSSTASRQRESPSSHSHPPHAERSEYHAHYQPHRRNIGLVDEQAKVAEQLRDRDAWLGLAESKRHSFATKLASDHLRATARLRESEDKFYNQQASAKTAASIDDDSVSGDDDQSQQPPSPLLTARSDLTVYMDSLSLNESRTSRSLHSLSTHNTPRKLKAAQPRQSARSTQSPSSRSIRAHLHSYYFSSHSDSDSGKRQQRQKQYEKKESSDSASESESDWEKSVLKKTRNSRHHRSDSDPHQHRRHQASESESEESSDHDCHRGRDRRRQRSSGSESHHCEYTRSASQSSRSSRSTATSAQSLRQQRPSTAVAHPLSRHRYQHPNHHQQRPSTASVESRSKSPHKKTDGWSKSIRVDRPEYDQVSALNQQFDPDQHSPFAAKPLPTHILGKKYNRMIKQQMRESKRRRKAERAKLFAAIQPFKFEESARVREKRARVVDSGSDTESDDSDSDSEEERYSRPLAETHVAFGSTVPGPRPKTAPPRCDADDRHFRARDMPESSRVEILATVMAERERKRERRKQQRAKELIAQSALPPRMEMHAKSDKSKDSARSRSDRADAKPKPKRREVPDFMALQRQFEAVLQRRKQERSTTQPQPFDLTDTQPKSSAPSDIVSERQLSRKEREALAKKESMAARARERLEAKQLAKAEADAESARRAQLEAEEKTNEVALKHSQQIAAQTRANRAALREADQRWAEQVQAMNAKVRANRTVLKHGVKTAEERIKARRAAVLAIAESLDRAGIKGKMKAAYFDADELRDLDLDIKW